MKNLLKTTVFSIILASILALSCQKSEVTFPQKSEVNASISNNEDFLWITKSVNDYSNKITTHFSSLSNEEYLSYTKIMKDGTNIEKESLIAKILGFNDLSQYKKFSSEYNEKSYRVSLYINEHSIDKESVDKEFKELLRKYRQYRTNDACSQYESCVHHKFSEGAFTGLFGGGFSGGFAGAVLGAVGGAAGSAIWHATFGDCAGFRNNCHR